MRTIGREHAVAAALALLIAVVMVTPVLADTTAPTVASSGGHAALASAPSVVPGAVAAGVPAADQQATWHKPKPVPEPSTMALLAMGGSGLVAWLKRRKAA